MMEYIIFGKLSRFFDLLKIIDEIRFVLKYFGCYLLEIFVFWLYGFVFLRNICVYYGKIWDRNFLKDLQFLKKLVQWFIIKDYESLNNVNNSYIWYYYGIGGCLFKSLLVIFMEKGNKFWEDVWNLIDYY